MPLPWRRGIKTPYYKKVLSISPSTLIGYWPMWEATGATVSLDQSAQANNGAYSGVTLGQPGIGDKKVCPSFDGNDFNNIYSAGFAADFTPAEHTLACWGILSDAAIWTDGAEHQLVYLSVDGITKTSINKSSTNNTLSGVYTAGGVTDQVVVGSQAMTDWFHLAMTVSVAADELKLYINGVQAGTTQSTLGTWVGALSSVRTMVGARLNNGTSGWSGRLAHAVIHNAALSAAQIASLATR